MLEIQVCGGQIYSLILGIKSDFKYPFKPIFSTGNIFIQFVFGVFEFCVLKISGIQKINQKWYDEFNINNHQRLKIPYTHNTNF